ncbi:chemotaxis protein CheV [Desulfuromonas versatilis]|uniref:Chemotaxis protein CheV n=1 Tax=Desulfuromonas versatilis TaxID=2802975 RepID=A0ABM8HW15_9BACT|nr:chemotaxis protein [Desulfuromonas versatilis]BCR06526.1 chemotaxis protein CheV [Desulfuromonas versatilis]
MTMATQKQEILLESGTNEMEIMEFYLGSQAFGINVHKLREIIPYDGTNVTRLPGGGDSMIGTILVRGRSLTLIDLGKHLRRKAEPAAAEPQRRIVLICEFNRTVNGFLVDGVNQIHRVSWKDVNHISDFLGRQHPRFTGSISIDGKEILIVDFEHIVAEIDPEMVKPYDVSEPAAGSPANPVAELAERRRQVPLMLAEDSAIIREGIVRVLGAAGYTNLKTFVDGEECYRAIRGLQQRAQQAGEDFSRSLKLVISDIEMPEMDGLTLCRKIKQDLGLEQVPVLMFSSLITDQMIVRCEEVGADGYVSKPQIPELVELLDRYCLQD